MVMTAGSIAWIALLETEPSPNWLAPVAAQPPWVLAVAATMLVFLVYSLVQLRYLPSHLRARHKSTLDPEQLQPLMFGAPPQIVDLRTREAYAGEEGHIRGALNIPFSELRQRIAELDTSNPRPIVLVDENDLLSHQAMPLLEARGHRWIYVLKGGYRAWVRANYPVYHTQAEAKKK